MSIGIVIVTYNSAAALPACLKSIPAGAEIVVVDNASRDASADIAAAHGARVVRNALNRGFGAACNQGAQLINSAHVLFLNPDVVLSAEALAGFETALKRYPDAGAFAPRIELPSGKSSFRYTSHIDEQGKRYTAAADAPAGDCCVQFIDGAAFLCDKSLFLSIGGFDETFFLYFEDDDLSYRIVKAGKSLIYLPGIAVFHQKQASSKPSLKLDYRRAWHQTASRIKLSRKHGLPLDLSDMKKRAGLRFARALLTGNIRKSLRYLATFRAAAEAG